MDVKDLTNDELLTEVLTNANGQKQEAHDQLALYMWQVDVKDKKGFDQPTTPPRIP